MPGMPDGWRDVPMPPRIAALPRTKAGIPITYTVAWTGERGMVFKPDPLLNRLGLRDRPAIFPPSGGQGEGTPKLSIVETSRQRRAAVLGLCQVCGHPIPEPSPRRPRWLADFTKGQSIRIGASVVPLVIDTWTCPDCLRYALKVCPALIHRRREGFHLLRVRGYRLVATFEMPDAPELAAHAPKDGAVGLVKIAPTDFDVIEPDTWLEADGAGPGERCAGRPAHASSHNEERHHGKTEERS